MVVSWTYKSPKWSKRFCNSLDSDPIGFDGITDGGHTKTTDPDYYEALNLKERWGCLASRIVEHGCFFRSSCPFPLPPTLPVQWLAWNKNPQCPPDEWKEMSVPFVPTGKKSFKGLAVQRHSKVKSTLDNINHIELSFSINNDIDLGYGFWLIDDQYKDFVYAILKSSMFRAWCELTAADKGREKGHFSTGMWDTFPIQDTTTPLSKLSNRYMANMFQREGGAMTVEGAISCAGRWLSRNVWKQHSPTLSFDECMDELCGFGTLISDKLCPLVPLLNLKLSTLPRPLSQDVADLFKLKRDISIKEAIRFACEWKRRGWKKGPKKISTVGFDKCMEELCSLPLVQYSLRIQILAEGFLDAFYGA